MLFYKNLLTLRAKQSYRLFAELGFLLFVISLAFLTIIGLSFLQKISTFDNFLWGFIMIIPALILHFSRKDARFLNSLGKNNKLIFLIEYGILGIPFLLLLLLFQNPITIIIGSTLLSILTFCINTNIKSSFKTYSYSWIPLYFFEWRMGFRQNGVFLIILYIITLVFSKFEGVILVFTFLFSFSIIPFYDFCEPKEWISRKFSLFRKIINHILLWTLVLLPHAILALYFHPEYFFLPLIAWYFGTLNIVICNTYKYAKWSPFRHNVGINVVSSVFLPLIFLFVTSPITIVASLYFFSKAKKNKFIKC